MERMDRQCIWLTLPYRLYCEWNSEERTLILQATGRRFQQRPENAIGRMDNILAFVKYIGSQFSSHKADFQLFPELSRYYMFGMFYAEYYEINRVSIHQKEMV